MKYLLQNLSAGYVGNSPLFWKEGGSGYTQWINEAQRWSLEEATKIVHGTSGSHHWAIWSEEEVNHFAKMTVDIQDLRKANWPSDVAVP